MKFMRFIFKRRLNAWDLFMMPFIVVLILDGWYFSAFFVQIAVFVVSVMAENMAGFKYGEGDE